MTGEPPEAAGAASLYQEAIIALAKEALAMPLLDEADVRVTVDNPLCGDRVTLDLLLEDGGRIRKIGNKTRGCLLCQAASAAIGRNAPGRTAADLEAETALLGEALQAGFDQHQAALWPDLRVFAPVHRHKSRRDCVLLPFKALLQGLDQAG